MNECYMDKKGNMVISEWYRPGGMLHRRDALPLDHKESTFQCIKRLGGNPYDHLDIQCPTCGQQITKEDQV